MDNWTHHGVSDGTSLFRLSSWSQFFDFLEAEVFKISNPKSRSYIWRGQRNTDWSLSTTLDRKLEDLAMVNLLPAILDEEAQEHLERFKYATRGRRGTTPANLSENEWWALGQHFGLATPLLDWTRAPFAALYFAYAEAHAGRRESRAVYALDEVAVRRKVSEVSNGPSVERGRLALVEVVDPMSDENQRLVSQGGCFTRAPIGTPIEMWVSQAFEGSTEPVLIKIEMPNEGRLECLQALSRMNINHLSLFPDLTGASLSTNLRLEILNQRM